MISLRKNGCILSIESICGRVYPRATGKVPKALKKGMEQIDQMRLTEQQALSMLRDLF